jgi:RNA polymerase sigma-70 factor (ECF subfamily)
MMLRWCRAWGLQESDAQDVVQNVMLELSRQMREFRYDSGGSFRAWLKTVARRAWMRYLETRTRHSAIGDAEMLAQLRDPYAEDDLVRHLEEEYERQILQQALDRVRLRVKVKTFEAFRLTALEGLSGREAALQLGMPVSHVYVAKGNVQKMVAEEIAGLDRGDRK